MYLTWLDSNTWLIEMAGQRILLDPWLVGPLVFGNLTWLFTSSRRQERSIPDNLDLILLSQGLPDHAHRPTLEALDRSIPVVASPSAAKVAQALGYTQVTVLEHAATLTCNQLEIRAFPGAPIGPLTVENAYLLKDLADKTTLYYEPHGYHNPQLKQYAPVDVVITPVESLSIPMAGAIIQGAKTAVQIAEWLQPQIMLPTAAGGDVEYSGLLATVLQAQGGVAELRSQLAERQLATQVLEVPPGDRVPIQLKPRLPELPELAELPE